MPKAVEAAQEAYKRTHQTINGVSVNIGSNHFPPDFESAVVPLLEEFAEDVDIEADELTLRPHGGSGRFWTVVRKDNLMPVGTGGRGSVFATKDIMRGLHETEASTQAETEEKVRERNDLNNKFRGLSPKHTSNHLRFTPDSQEYLDLQKRFGKDIYPDGGLITDDQLRSDLPAR